LIVILISKAMKKIFLIFCGVFLLISCVSCSNFDPEKDGKLVRDACELPPPPESRQLDEREIFRPHAGGISKFYSHESGCLAVENHYKRVLKDLGWEEVPKTSFSHPDYIYFRKGDVWLSLTCSESRDLWGTKRFSISCSKGIR